MPASADFLLQQQLDLAARVGESGIVAVSFECPQPGRTDSLVALYRWRREAGRAVPTHFLVTDKLDDQAVVSAIRTDRLEGSPERLEEGPEQLEDVARRLGVPLFDLHAPALLDPVAIPKPWGQEIWFTGIEERGVSRIGDGRHTIPLPWYLHAAPARLANHRHEHVNLLKILDPLPDPLLGDLYFELHEEKQEVYVVTGVDRAAWPDGRGAIRLGFRADARQAHGSEEAFRGAYREAVAHYRTVREAIDERIDREREAEGVALDAPVAPEVQRRWLAGVPETLREEERTRRAAMNAFTQLWPLQVGDVVQVPLLTPHALQHGVRTVEFQTPVYERKILSFGQKVLTQPHWDTDEAIAQMVLDVEALSQCDTLSSGVGWRQERIVTFDDFVVDRLTVEAGQQWALEADGEYALLMAVGTAFEVGQLVLAHEQACFVPAERAVVRCRNASQEQGVLLIARPR